MTDTTADALATVRSAVTADVVSRFRREGWIRLPRLLSDDEVARVREIYAIEEETGTSKLMGDVTGDDDDRFAYQRDPKMTKMWSNRIDLRLRWPELQRIVALYAIVARSLLGADDVRVFWDKTFTKPTAAEGTRESVWHQDLPYNPIDRRGFMSVWFAVTDVTAEMGAMRFVPGSHRLGPLGRFDLVGDEHTWDFALRPEDRDLVGEPVTVPLAAGEATVHDGLTLHGAGPNLTDTPRRGWTMIFIPADTRWTGGPHPHADNNIAGMVMNDTFDDERFLVDWAAIGRD
ncbi:MAG: phytanoyl-CoA dioxygenase family protein [Acidimicrobiales bacterium]